MMSKKTCGGFTLPEVLLSAVIAGMVFFALGTVLTRSFSIWYSGMAQWKLATQARVARVRLLDGGFGKGTGLLSATNHTVNLHPGGWKYVGYYPVVSGKEFHSYGLISEYGRDHLWLKNTDDDIPGLWMYGQAVKNYGAEEPDVKVGGFDAEIKENNNILEITYALHLSAGGKDFEQPQTIRVVLLNSE